MLWRLQRGAYHHYPLVVFYLVVFFLTGVADAALYFGPGHWTAERARAYYFSDSARHLARFVLALYLVWKVGAGDASLARLRRRLMVASGLLVPLSFLVGSGKTFGLYMTAVSRNLSFVATLLVMALWMMLARRRWYDPQLLLVTAGLGVNMAGDAMAQSLIALSRRLVALGGWLSVLSHITGLLIWFYAFKPTPRSSGENTTAR